MPETHCKSYLSRSVHLSHVNYNKVVNWYAAVVLKRVECKMYYEHSKLLLSRCPIMLREASLSPQLPIGINVSFHCSVHLHSVQ